MRIAAFIGVLAGLVLTAGAIVATGSAHSHKRPALLMLHANDRFEVADSGVACRVLSRGVPYPNRLVCFMETQQQTYTHHQRSHPGHHQTLAVSFRCLVDAWGLDISTPLEARNWTPSSSGEARRTRSQLAQL